MKPESTVRTVILAAIEPSAASDQVVHTAVAMSRIVPGADLHFVHIVNPGPPPHETALSMTDLLAEGRAYLDGVVNGAKGEATCRVSGHLAVGVPAERIVQIAADISTDLLIVGTHEKKGLARVIGSVSQKVLVRAPCPVLLARVKAMVEGPEIEPPCPACLETQRATHGETLWCKQHSQRHVHGHLHYNVANGFGGGSMFIR